MVKVVGTFVLVIAIKMENINEYIYLGDKLTDPALKNKPCRAIRNRAGKCIRSPMATMLVEFEGGQLCVILARRLRKIIK